MADPTWPDPSHKKLTRPGSKFFDPDPSLTQREKIETFLIFRTTFSKSKPKPKKWLTWPNLSNKKLTWPNPSDKSFWPKPITNCKIASIVQYFYLKKILLVICGIILHKWRKAGWRLSKFDEISTINSERQAGACRKVIGKRCKLL